MLAFKLVLIFCLGDISSSINYDVNSEKKSQDNIDDKPNDKRTSKDGFRPRKVRDYFLQAEKVDWDYLPQRRNLASFYDKYLNDTLVNKADRIGSVYSKFIYKQYTDDTYTAQIPANPSFGYLGPLLRGEVGEIIQVHFRNNISVPVTVHPHGVRYNKDKEGASYMDRTSNDDKLDDGVPPGESYTYTWEITAEFAPGHDGPPCVPYAYHSHRKSDMEINTGLIGLLVVCKQGTLDEAGKRRDVDAELILYFDSIDEGQSLLLDDNIKRCGDPEQCKRLLEDGDPEFEESLKKDSINGYMYGNMPAMEVCEGDKIAWYMFSLNAELHPVNIHGQTLVSRKHRSSVIGLWSATFREADMIAANPGRWPIQCMNSEHNTNGMKEFLIVHNCSDAGSPTAPPLQGIIREYYMAAEAVVWNYASSGVNKLDNRPLADPDSPSAQYFAKNYNGGKGIGGTYKKSRFVQYHDPEFSIKRNQSKPELHMGILGPVVRAEVGDVIRITLKNKTPFPVSIFLQGTSLRASQNGMRIRAQDSDTDVMNSGRITEPGSSLTYEFSVPYSVAPGDADPDCLPYIYYSDVNMERDVNSGLIGPLLICRPGTIDKETGRQKYVDREMFLYISSINENLSWYINDNIDTYIGDKAEVDDEAFVESNMMRAINGYSYGNVEGLNMCRNDNVVWYVISFGEAEGNHGITFNGNNIVIDGTYRDSHVIISGQTFSAFMKPDNVGSWAIYCSDLYHYNAGLTSLYHVDACGDQSVYYHETSGKVRRFYIGAVERMWDYSPETIHPITGENYSDPSSDQYNRVRSDGQFIGSVYWKAMYRLFTDESFTQEVPVTDQTHHLGILGPFIKAEVGDTVEVVFKNMASRNYSMHAQGLRYNKSNEGMGYSDGETANQGDAVPPGGVFKYRWEVPSSSGPAPNSHNCVNFMYHSAVNPERDIYSGLVGPIVVCRKGTLNDNNERKDSVEREFALMFQAFDENRSWYIDRNVKESFPSADTTSDEVMESNMYDSINGLIYNNVKGLIAKRGDNIAWYIIGLGGIEDIHTIHFHGHVYSWRTSQTQAGDVIEVFPGTYETVEMFASSPGTWLFHCHVGEHMADGMVGTYTILE